MANKTRNPLTPRQLEFTALAANGLTFEQIAAECLVSTNTVTNVMADARNRAEARNVTHLVSMALRGGWIELRVTPLV